jgi:hypothetical protein
MEALKRNKLVEQRRDGHYTLTKKGHEEIKTASMIQVERGAPSHAPKHKVRFTEPKKPVRIVKPKPKKPGRRKRR